MRITKAALKGQLSFYAACRQKAEDPNGIPLNCIGKIYYVISKTCI